MGSEEYKRLFEMFVHSKLQTFFDALRPFYASRGKTDDSLSYFRNHFDRFELMIKICNEYVPNLKSICEVGSFYPYISYYFKLNNKTEKINLYDIILNELKNPCEPYDVDGIQLINFNLCKQSLIETNKKYDLVICSEVIEHLPIDLSKFKKELKGIVNDGGYLMITYPLGGKNANGYNEVVEGIDIERMQHDHIREFTMETSSAFITDIPLIYSEVIRAKAYGKIRICLYKVL